MKRLILKQHSLLIVLVTRILDIFICVVGALLANVLYFGLSQFRLSLAYAELVAVAILLVLLAFPVLGIYQSWRSRNLAAPVVRSLFGWCVVFTFVLVLLVVMKRAETYSRIWLALWFTWVAILLIAQRFIAYSVLRYLCQRGWNNRRAIVIGAGSQARVLVQRAREDAWAGFVVERVFYLDGKPDAFEGVELAPLSELQTWITANPTDEVWIALPLTHSGRLPGVLAQLSYSTANIRYVPDLAEIFLLNHGMCDLMNVPMIDLRSTFLEGDSRLIKALEDRVLAAIILVFISPAMLLIAIGVKLSSRGPILFRQKRNGWGGHEFSMYKFRTMRVHNDDDGPYTQASRNDSRVTRFGTFLRRTSLDELPQLINVLLGEMSIVGPRPHPVKMNLLYHDSVANYMLRHNVKPGITGWAQVNGLRGETDTEEKMRQRVKYDLYYIENWTLWFDIKIILLTFFKGFVNRNAY